MSGPISSNRPKPKFNLSQSQPGQQQKPAQLQTNPLQPIQSQNLPTKIQTQQSQPKLESTRVKPKFNLSQSTNIQQVSTPIQPKKTPNITNSPIQTSPSYDKGLMDKLNGYDRKLKDIGNRIEALIKEKSSLSDDSISLNKIFSFMKISDERTSEDIDAAIRNLCTTCDEILLDRTLTIQQLGMHKSDPLHTPSWLPPLEAKVNSLYPPQKKISPTSTLSTSSSSTNSNSKVPLSKQEQLQSAIQQFNFLSGLSQKSQGVISQLNHFQNEIQRLTLELNLLQPVNGQTAINAITALSQTNSWSQHPHIPQRFIGIVNNVTYEWDDNLKQLISPPIEDGSILRHNNATGQYEFIKTTIQYEILSSSDESSSEEYAPTIKLKSHTPKDILDVANQLQKQHAWRNNGQGLLIAAVKDSINQEVLFVMNIATNQLMSPALPEDTYIFFSNDDEKFNILT